MQVSWIGTTKLSVSVNMNVCKSVFLKAWQYLIFRVLLYFQWSILYWPYWPLMDSYCVFTLPIGLFFFRAPKLLTHAVVLDISLISSSCSGMWTRKVYFSFSHIMDPSREYFPASADRLPHPYDPIEDKWYGEWMYRPFYKFSNWSKWISIPKLTYFIKFCLVIDILRWRDAKCVDKLNLDVCGLV